jgi:hypothetical protein
MTAVLNVRQNELSAALSGDGFPCPKTKEGLINNQHRDRRTTFLIVFPQIKADNL